MKSGTVFQGSNSGITDPILSFTDSNNQASIQPPPGSSSNQGAILPSSSGIPNGSRTFNAAIDSSVTSAPNNPGGIGSQTINISSVNTSNTPSAQSISTGQSSQAPALGSASSLIPNQNPPQNSNTGASKDGQTKSTPKKYPWEKEKPFAPFEKLIETVKFKIDMKNFTEKQGSEKWLTKNSFLESIMAGLGFNDDDNMIIWYQQTFFTQHIGTAANIILAALLFHRRSPILPYQTALTGYKNVDFEVKVFQDNGGKVGVRDILFAVIRALMGIIYADKDFAILCMYMVMSLFENGQNANFPTIVPSSLSGYASRVSSETLLF